MMTIQSLEFLEWMTDHGYDILLIEEMFQEKSVSRCNTTPFATLRLQTTLFLDLSESDDEIVDAELVHQTRQYLKRACDLNRISMWLQPARDWIDDIRSNKLQMHDPCSESSSFDTFTNHENSEESYLHLSRFYKVHRYLCSQLCDPSCQCEHSRQLDELWDFLDSVLNLVERFHAPHKEEGVLTKLITAIRGTSHNRSPLMPPNSEFCLRSTSRLHGCPSTAVSPRVHWRSVSMAVPEE
eukprot:GHVH01000411.1.p1 GENE.GHVH01000411.1~~GHVH01000411.1.p1  ORF type:complete len:240 (+),score=28.68 GHVH01000411.1:622-1341(+)